MAEWKWISSDSQGNDFFIDVETIRIDGDFRKVWSYMNSSEGIHGAKSIRSRYEVNCKSERYRYSSLSAFAEKDLKGKQVGSEDGSRNWIDIPPNTNITTFYEIVCR